MEYSESINSCIETAKSAIDLSNAMIDIIQRLSSSPIPRTCRIGVYSSFEITYEGINHYAGSGSSINMPRTSNRKFGFACVKTVGPTATGTCGVIHFSGKKKVPFTIMWSVPFDSNLYSAWAHAERGHLDFDSMYSGAQCKGGNWKDYKIDGMEIRLQMDNSLMDCHLEVDIS